MALIDNLTHYYKLDEVNGAVIDAVGANNGTNNGATTNIAGKINTSYGFNNLADYITYGARLLDPSAAYTLGFWFRTPADTTNYGTIFQQWSGAFNTNTYRIILYTAADFRIFVDKSGYNTAKSSVFNTNTWYYITISNDGAGHLKIYVNGSQVLNSPFTITFTGNYNSVIGTSVNACTEYLMDEIAIWDRQLSDAEVGTGAGTLYNDGAGLAYPFTTPAGGGHVIAQRW